MTFCFHSLAILTLITIQTTVVPYHGILHRFYDLPLIFVIYLGLYRPLREGIPLIIILGLIMDSLSGSPLGIYVTSYVWIYGGCIWFLTFFHVHSRMLLVLIVAVAVTLENSIFIFGLILQGNQLDVANTILPMVAVQVLWAVFTAPWLIVFLGIMQGYVTRRYNEYKVKQNGQ